MESILRLTPCPRFASDLILNKVGSGLRALQRALRPHCARPQTLRVCSYGSRNVVGRRPLGASLSQAFAFVFARRPGAQNNNNTIGEKMSFDESAKKLSRNPLGIIALFILLIYGFATILFGITSNTITENQKWPFIIFIVVFPVLVLFVFYSLVRNHHTKLYAPMDYRNENNFMQYQTSIEKEQKLDKEVNAEIASVESAIQTIDPPNKAPEIDLRQKISKYEELVLSKLELNYQAEIKRNVYFGAKNKERGFDGFAELRNQFIFFEVKYLRRELFPISILENIIYKVMTVKQDMFNSEKYRNYKFKLVIVIVMEMDDTQIIKLKNHISKYLDSNLMDLEIKYFRTSDLDK
jgi:hypothetical protein